MRTLLGYSIHPPFIGQIDGMHPPAAWSTPTNREHKTEDHVIADRVLTAPAARRTRRTLAPLIVIGYAAWQWGRLGWPRVRFGLWVPGVDGPPGCSSSSPRTCRAKAFWGDPTPWWHYLITWLLGRVARRRHHPPPLVVWIGRRWPIERRNWLPAGRAAPGRAASGTR